MSSFLEKMKQQKLLSVTLLLITLALGILLGTLINTGVKAAKDGTPVAPDATPITIPQASAVGNEFTKSSPSALKPPSSIYIPTIS